MKLQKIVRTLWRGEVYETRSVLFVPMSLSMWEEFYGSPAFRDLYAECKSIDWHGSNELELLVKVFHDSPEGVWRKAKAIRRLLRWIRARGGEADVTTMPHRWREPKWCHRVRDHYTHRPIRRVP